MSNYKITLQSNNESISSNNIDLQGLIDQANALPDAGGVDLPELSNEGSASDLLSGKELIDSDGNVVTGTIVTKTSSNLTASGATVTVPAGYYASQATKSVATATQATPSVSIDSAGKITASATQSAGYVSAGTKTGTKQLTTQAAKTITPTKSSQTAVAKDVYTTGAVTVAAIPSQYITTTDATASADEIMSGETAYVNGSKVTGTFSINSELATQDDLIAQLSAAVNSLPDAGSGGSGGAELKTCTLTITTDSFMEVYGVCATMFVNGTVSSVSFACDYGNIEALVTPYVIENVLVNSAVFIQARQYALMGITTNGVSKTDSFYGAGILTFKVNEDADNATIHIYDND